MCLKVLEYILTPDETLMSINPVIQKVKTLGEFKLVAYFVTEKMVFYQNIPQIAEKYEFEISHLQLAKS